MSREAAFSALFATIAAAYPWGMASRRMKLWSEGRHLWARTIGSTVLGEGVDNGTIEQRLQLSPTGVEKHIRAIRDILGIHRRRELVIYAAVRRWGPAQQAAPAPALGSPHALKEWRFG